MYTVAVLGLTPCLINGENLWLICVIGRGDFNFRLTTAKHSKGNLSICVLLYVHLYALTYWTSFTAKDFSSFPKRQFSLAVEWRLESLALQLNRCLRYRSELRLISAPKRQQTKLYNKSERLNSVASRNADSHHKKKKKKEEKGRKKERRKERKKE